MAERSNKTEVHEADNLLPAADAQPKAPEVGDGFKMYSVNVEGHVYSVKARTVEEAGKKAKKLHKDEKGSK